MIFINYRDWIFSQKENINTIRFVLSTGELAVGRKGKLTVNELEWI
jgi:hypothetical protein